MPVSCFNYCFSFFLPLLFSGCYQVQLVTDDFFSHLLSFNPFPFLFLWFVLFHSLYMINPPPCTSYILVSHLFCHTFMLLSTPFPLHPNYFYTSDITRPYFHIIKWQKHILILSHVSLFQETFLTTVYVTLVDGSTSFLPADTHLNTSPSISSHLVNILPRYTSCLIPASNRNSVLLSYSDM